MKLAADDFYGLASLFTNLLNANNIFGLPAFSTSVNNIFIIISALTLGSRYGIQGLALGTVLAMAAMALVQFPTLLKSGFKFRLALDLRHPGVQKVYILALPAATSVAVNQANVYINGVLASWLPEGSISALSYADRLIQFPVSLFVLALGTAVFPALSGWAARGDQEDLAKILLTSMKVVIAGIIPASVGLMVLSQPIVKLVFERGAFDQAASAMTAAALFLCRGPGGTGFRHPLNPGFLRFAGYPHTGQAGSGHRRRQPDPEPVFHPLSPARRPGPG